MNDTPLTFDTEGWRVAYKSIKRTLGQHEYDEIILEAIKQIGLNEVETAYFPDDVANRILSSIEEYDKQWRFVDEWE